VANLPAATTRRDRGRGGDKVTKWRDTAAAARDPALPARGSVDRPQARPRHSATGSAEKGRKPEGPRPLSPFLAGCRVLLRGVVVNVVVAAL